MDTISQVSVPFPREEPVEPARRTPERKEWAADRLDREAFFTAAESSTPYLAVEVGQAVFFVSTADHGVGRGLYVHRWRKDMARLHRALERLGVHGSAARAASTFVEVGANIGTTTVTALGGGHFAHAVALEPSPENFRLLQINLVANGVLDRATLLPVAAFDRPGPLTLNVSSRNKGSHRILGAEGPQKPKLDEDVSRTAVIEAVTLDGLVAEGTIDPDGAGFVWIDAPRSEARVLTGATDLLTRGVPVVVALKPGSILRDSPLADLLAQSYTTVVELGGLRRTLPARDLPQVTEELENKCDVLLLRAGRT